MKKPDKDFYEQEVNPDNDNESPKNQECSKNILCEQHEDSKDTNNENLNAYTFNPLIKKILIVFLVTSFLILLGFGLT